MAKKSKPRPKKKPSKRKPSRVEKLEKWVKVLEERIDHQASMLERGLTEIPERAAGKVDAVLTEAFNQMMAQLQPKPEARDTTAEAVFASGEKPEETP